MPNILIVEDDEEIRKIEKDYLKRENYTIFEAKDGDEALDIFENNKINLIILDLNLPFRDGIDVCKNVRLKSGVPIIMVTARTKEIDELLGLEIGADDYLKKPFSPKILVARIQSLLKRPVYDDGKDIIRVKNLELDIKKKTLKKDSTLLLITNTQFNILFTLMKNKGRAFSRYELLERSSSDMVDVFDRTMDSHIKNIRKLIEEDSRNPQYILTVRGKGYKFNENL